MRTKRKNTETRPHSLRPRDQEIKETKFRRSVGTTRKEDRLESHSLMPAQRNQSSEEERKRKKMPTTPSEHTKRRETQSHSVSHALDDQVQRKKRKNTQLPGRNAREQERQSHSATHKRTGSEDASNERTGGPEFRRHTNHLVGT
jgi:hypothetical protein